MATAQHTMGLVEVFPGAAMTGVLLDLQPALPSARAVPCSQPGSPTPEWHVLRLFGHGRHPVNFEAGRERIVEL